MIYDSPNRNTPEETSWFGLKIIIKNEKNFVFKKNLSKKTKDSKENWNYNGKEILIMKDKEKRFFK